MPFTYDFPRPAVTADTVLFTMKDGDLAVLLIQRKHAPFKGAWAFPGGFVDENEALERAAARELAEETGITGVPLEQLGAFGEPGRDPRGHTITVAYYSFVVVGPVPAAADDAADAAWQPLQRIERGDVKLAFDHGPILAVARSRLRERLFDRMRPAAFEIVPPRFTLKELKAVYQAILGELVPARSFRARVVDGGLIEPVSRGRRGPAQLYRWKTPRGA